jgi:haloacetate dehalogenase
VFAGFSDERIEVGGLALRVRHCAGDGPPVVLLHGHPRTSATWHRVAPLLRATGRAVVCPDLRGYGRSEAPPTTADHAQSSKRAMAADVRTVLRRLGHERFVVVGHDRGSYVALRLALDHPEAVAGLVVLDGIPIIEHLQRCDDRFATAYWHWFFFAQPDKPERAVLADPDAWYGAGPEAEARMGAENYAEYRPRSTTPPPCTR